MNLQPEQIKEGINIVFFVTKNYNNIEAKNSVSKNLNIIDQFLMAYYSIKNNLKNYDYDISLFYNKNFKFNETDFSILKKLDINIFEAEPDHPKVHFHCRHSALTKKLPKNFSHRLILDTDVIILNNLKLDLTCDWQAMYASNGSYNDETNYINKKYNFNLDLNIYEKNNLLYNTYMKDGNINKNLFPHFNGGAWLIKENLCKKFVESYIKAYELTFDKNHKKLNHIGIQYATSFALIKLSKNWKPFSRGINYLLPISNIDNYNNFSENDIQIIHYCGCSGIKALSNFMKKYNKYEYNLLNFNKNIY